MINKNWRPEVYVLAKEEQLIEDYPVALCMTLEEALEKIEKLRNGERDK